MVLGENMEDNLKFQVIGTGKELFASWFKVKEELGSHIVAKGLNPHYKNDYIMLDTLINKIDKACIKHNLGIMQLPTGDGIITIILHKTSGHYIQTYYSLVHLDKKTPQGVGSALTYAKRQILQAMFGLSAGPEEDDDGEYAENDNDNEAEKVKNKNDLNSQKNAFSLSKQEIKNLKTMDQLAKWWSQQSDTFKSNKAIKDLKDSRKSELSMKV